MDSGTRVCVGGGAGPGTGHLCGQGRWPLPAGQPGALGPSGLSRGLPAMARTQAQGPQSQLQGKVYQHPEAHVLAGSPVLSRIPPRVQDTSPGAGGQELLPLPAGVDTRLEGWNPACSPVGKGTAGQTQGLRLEPPTARNEPGQSLGSWHTAAATRPGRGQEARPHRALSAQRLQGREPPKQDPRGLETQSLKPPSSSPGPHGGPRSLGSQYHFCSESRNIWKGQPLSAGGTGK